MAKTRPVGPCHLCGVVGPLSFEHVPPESAFNNRPIVAKLVDDIRKSGGFEKAKGALSQRGAGAYSLCERCNNNTGSWYGSAFVEWVYQGVTILNASNKEPSLYYNFHIFPLRILKQIVCMFFSINDSSFRLAHPELEKFVLDKNRKYLPGYVHIHAFYAVGKYAREAGVTGRFDIGNSSKNSMFSELAFHPYGFVMSFDRPPDERLVDISRFGFFDYNSFKSIPLQLPVLQIFNHLPGDYRTEAEIEKAIAANTKQTLK